MAAKITDHKEFRQLIETSGPFLSTSVLKSAFPQGFAKEEGWTDLTRHLRLSYEEWTKAQEASAFDLASHRGWIRTVLTDVLEFSADTLAEGQGIPQSLRVAIPERHDTVAPDLVITIPPVEDLIGESEPPTPVMLVQIYESTQGLTKPVRKGAGSLSPVDRMTALLRGSGQRLGLVTNGEQWTLVHVPESTDGVTSTAAWYGTGWFDEPFTLRAFRALLGARRFFSVAKDETLLRLLERSALNQLEVTDQLGKQVRQAVEVLIRALDRSDQDRGHGLLKDVGEQTLYEAAIAVMMRLVFLFSAEERGLLLLNYELYDSNYAVSPLGDQLREMADRDGEAVLERRRDAWSRLLAAFRAVHSGLEHDRLTLPAYGGQLFDPDRYPFLEGRPSGSSWRDTPATPLPVNNRTVLHVLNALQILEERGGEPRRLTFRELDIPQIGHVYESLLDHTAKRTSEVVLGLAGAGKSEPEIALSELERWREQGEGVLVEALKEATGRSEPAIRRALAVELDTYDRDRFRAACASDEPLLGRVLPFAGLVRDDTFKIPTLILPGSIYVTEGTDRRSSGTHYTPVSLTEPIVRHTLEPLVYSGPVDGKPREEWTLKSASELLKLKICDMACGSGAFLVQACRFMAAHLMEAWKSAEEAHPGVPGITPEGHESVGLPGEELIPMEDDERKTYALRIVAQRCLYGVDKNPLAVEMAKLSLWLLTLAKGKPFTFLDHAIKCGDSLLGVDKRQLLAFRLDGERPPQGHLYTLSSKLDQVAEQRAMIGSQQVTSVRDLERLAFLLAGAEKQTESLRAIADILVGIEFLEMRPAERERVRDQEDNELPSLLVLNDLPELAVRAAKYRDGLRPFHWPLEFPEVFEDRDGFDAVIGNPPFIGGQKITGLLGRPYREFLVERLANGQRGSADYSAYFFLRARQMLHDGGCFGLLATNTIAQGDTREVGLDQVVSDCTLMRAIPSRKWPGEANLEVAHVWARRGAWPGPFYVEEREATGITSLLTHPGKALGRPYRLKVNQGKSYIGSYVLGMGFVLTPHEKDGLIALNPRNADLLFPYLNGEDLNSRPDQSASRWVINFRNWPLDRSWGGSWYELDDQQRQAVHRHGLVPADYPEPVAADYPDALEIVQTKVKPERDTNNRDVYRRKWWHYAEKRPELYATIAGLNRVLVLSLVNNHLGFAFSRPGSVLAHRLAVIATESFADFAIWQSHIHYHWAWQHSSTMRKDINYSPSDCVETFPIPVVSPELATIGEEYYGTRGRLLRARTIGLTKLYNMFHDRRARTQRYTPFASCTRTWTWQSHEHTAGRFPWTMDFTKQSLGCVSP